MSNDNDVTLTIDGKEITVPAGTLIVEAARRLGIYIPVFCYHDRLEPVGMCRMCLVKVGTPVKDKATGKFQLDEKGAPVISWLPKPQTACNTPVSAGMVVITNSAEVARERKAILEFLLTSHPLDCPVCDKGGECPLQDLTYRHGPGNSRFEYGDKFHFKKPVPLGELIWLDRERCVLCGRCIRFGDELAGDHVLAFENRGRAMEVVSYSDPVFDSVFSGNTTDICPVGALTTADFRFKARAWELTNVSSICNHCGVGCNIVLGTRTGQIMRIMPRKNDAVNEIWICDKGRFAHQFVGSPKRLTKPLIRRNGELAEATWDEALGTVADRLSAIVAGHGPQAIGGIPGPHLANEDLYLFQKFFRAVIGSNNVDHRIGSSAVMEDHLTATLGVGSGTDIGRLGADSVILVLGADIEETAPVLFLRLRKAANQGARLIGAGGRPTKLERFAGQVLRYRYGTVTHLLLGMLQVILEERLEAAEFLAQRSSGLGTLREKVASYAPVRVAEIVGVAEEEIAVAARAFASAENGIVIVGPEAGSLADGSWPALSRAVAKLLLITGHVGRADNGALLLLPHANSRGALDLGAVPDHLPGYAQPGDKEATERLARVWGVAPPAQPGLSAIRMLSEGSGIKALYIAGADPARHGYQGALRALDFLVVQEIIATETAALANVVLPACAFAERDGTFTNLERRVQRFDPGVPRRGDSRPDWLIITDLARRMGAEWPYASARGVLAEMVEAVPLYAGMGFEHLATTAPLTRSLSHYIYSGMSFDSPLNQGFQWPVSAEISNLQPPISIEWNEPPDITPPDADYPFTLVAPRVLYDRGMLISQTELLQGRVPAPYAALNSDDAQRLGIVPGDSILLVSPRSEARLVARLDAQLPAGVVVAPQNLNGADTLIGEGAILTRVALMR
jgi:NADH-quinone oxidoreductase subunit G